MAPRSKKGAPTQPKEQSGNARGEFGGRTGTQTTKSTKGKERSTTQSTGSHVRAGRASQPAPQTEVFTPIFEEKAFRMLWERAKQDCEEVE